MTRNEQEPDRRERADASVERLAHELSNLVQVVAGYLEMLSARTDDALSLQYLGNALAAARQIAELAESLDRESPPSRPFMFP